MLIARMILATIIFIMGSYFLLDFYTTKSCSKTFCNINLVLFTTLFISGLYYTEMMIILALIINVIAIRYLMRCSYRYKYFKRLYLEDEEYNSENNLLLTSHVLSH